MQVSAVLVSVNNLHRSMTGRLYNRAVFVDAQQLCTICICHNLNQNARRIARIVRRWHCVSSGKVATVTYPRALCCNRCAPVRCRIDAVINLDEIIRASYASTDV